MQNSTIDAPQLIENVTGSTFGSEVLKHDGPIAAEFMSYGCAHCRALEPVLQQAAEQLRSRETVVRVNIANEEGLASTYEISATPTLVMFENGVEVGRVEGPHPKLPSVLKALTKPFASSM